MMALINKYGLIHLCAKPEYEFINDYQYLYLDLYDYYNSTKFVSFTERQMSIYFRGTLDRSSRFNNLFEYLLLLSLHSN